MPKLYVDNRKALSYINRVMMFYSTPDSMLRESLPSHRRRVKALAERFRNCGHLPCGYQDQYGDDLDHAALDLRATLDALWLHKGIQSRYFRTMLDEALPA